MTRIETLMGLIPALPLPGKTDAYAPRMDPGPGLGEHSESILREPCHSVNRPLSAADFGRPRQVDAIWPGKANRDGLRHFSSSCQSVLTRLWRAAPMRSGSIWRTASPRRKARRKRSHPSRMDRPTCPGRSARRAYNPLDSALGHENVQWLARLAPASSS